MFLRVVRAAGGKGVKHEYVRVVEAYRERGKTRHRTVLNLGRRDLLATHLDFKVNAVVWYHAVNPARTIITVLDWHEAVRQAALTALRDTIGQSELDHLLKDRLDANLDLKQLLSAAVQKWGVEIAAVELKDLDIPENMQRAIAKEAEAIREKRARIIKADGELEAANKLNQAAAIIAPHPSALELRRLQALTEIGVEHNSVIIVSLPVENNTTSASAALAKSIADIDLARHPAQK